MQTKGPITQKENEIDTGLITQSLSRKPSGKENERATRLSNQ